jgi:hypothetical protein
MPESDSGVKEENAMRGIDYTRIERLAGGAAFFAALCNMTRI